MGSATFEIAFQDDPDAEDEVKTAAAMARAKVSANRVDRASGVRIMQVRMTRHSEELFRKLSIHKTHGLWRRVK